MHLVALDLEAQGTSDPFPVRAFYPPAPAPPWLSTKKGSPIAWDEIYANYCRPPVCFIKPDARGHRNANGVLAYCNAAGVWVATRHGRRTGRGEVQHMFEMRGEGMGN